MVHVLAVRAAVAESFQAFFTLEGEQWRETAGGVKKNKETKLVAALREVHTCFARK